MGSVFRVANYHRLWVDKAETRVSDLTLCKAARDETDPEGKAMNTWVLSYVAKQSKCLVTKKTVF